MQPHDVRWPARDLGIRQVQHLVLKMGMEKTEFPDNENAYSVGQSSTFQRATRALF